MTAPEDIIDTDNALAGEEVFDLGEGEREGRRTGATKKRALRDVVKDVDGMSDDDDETMEDDAESDGEVYSSDEERELKTQHLEGELDGLYDQYRERMQERDTKWKVKQERLRDKNYEKWGGIKDEEGSDDDEDEKIVKRSFPKIPRRGDADPDDEGEISEEGGWDLVKNQKATIGEQDSDSDNSSDEEEAPKRSRAEPKAAAGVETKAVKAKKTPQSLVTTLSAAQERAELSRQAQVWFDQSVFKDVGDLAALDGDSESEAESEAEPESDVEMEAAEAVVDAEDAESDVGYEVVPVDDGLEWDVDQEDQDEVKRKKIQGKL